MINYSTTFSSTKEEIAFEKWLKEIGGRK